MKENIIRKPNFFIVGFPRSGTTSMYYYLKQHPEIFMPDDKEPHYFSPFMAKAIAQIKKPYTESEYLALFKNRGEKMLGEASASYIFDEDSALRIKKFSGNQKPKIIIMVRNPVEASFSLYNKVYVGIPNIPDESHLVAWRRRMVNKDACGIEQLIPPWEIYRIYDHTRRYIDLFGKENIHIILFDDLKKNTRKTYKEVLDFLGVDNDFSPDFSIQNKSIKFKNIIFRKLFRTCLNNRILFKFAMFPFITRSSQLFLKSFFEEGCVFEYSIQERKEAVKFFENEIDKFSRLIRRDLSHWKDADKISFSSGG